MAIVYKICDGQEWRAAQQAGAYRGSADDARDGFIHFSTREQLAGTLQRYFADRGGLVIIAFDAARLGPALRYEPSRGGDLFPHLYAPLDTSAAFWVRPVERGEDGAPVLPDLTA
ncbi:MAG: DUF952 domain-containing protein [Alphaproteobacteria bacterium]